MWPINISHSHWCLTIGIFEMQNVYICDPYSPYDSKSLSVETKSFVEQVYNNLWKQYFKKYDLHCQWTVADDYADVRPYYFISQPSNNSTDCGVVVCHYIWCLMSGQRAEDKLQKIFSGSSARRHENAFTILRNWIGQYIVGEQYD